MEQSSNERNRKRQKLSVHVREELPSDYVLPKSFQVRRDSELSAEVELNVRKNNEIVTNNTQKLNEIAESSANVIGSRLDTINDDCLRQIFVYLDILDIVNLATISGRLLDFSEDVIFPKAAKEICSNRNSLGIQLSTRSLNQTSIYLTTQRNFDTVFQYIGKFVEDLTIQGIRPEDILAHCSNLSKLSLSYFNFKQHETHALQNQIESLQYLKELILLQCHGATFQWKPSKGISNVKNLTIGVCGHVNDNFIDYFKNLVSFSCHLIYYNLNFVRICDNNSHCLKNLKITDAYNRIASESVASLITDKLHKLENLELTFKLTDETMCFVQLPHLKSVDIRCEFNRSIKSELRTLSVRGTIEELKIYGGFFYEDFAEMPLNFNKLRTISLTLQMGLSCVLRIFTKSQMPEIQTIDVAYFTDRYPDDLCALIVTKNSLKSIRIHFAIGVTVPLSFWQQIICVLKDSPASQRPFLYVNSMSELEEEVVSKNTISIINIFKLSHIFFNISDRIAGRQSKSPNSCKCEWTTLIFFFINVFSKCIIIISQSLDNLNKF